MEARSRTKDVNGTRPTVRRETGALLSGRRGWDPVERRHVVAWANWQSALYALVLGWTCLVLAPLTSLWWIVPVVGAVAPIALALVSGRGSKPGKATEGELLEVLAERGEASPTVAALQTSLTVDEASEMLDGLARKGHLKPRIEGGVTTYALRERERHDTPGKTNESVPSKENPDGVESLRQPEEPLSGRELEVLAMIASGRTNPEIGRDLYVAVGTVKSHTGNIYRKLGVKNRTEALARAREHDLLP